jgi:hypothetical protein
MSKSLLAAALFLSGISQALAGTTNSVRLIQPVPTLDEVGLVGLSVVVGIAAGIVARRRKKK